MSEQAKPKEEKKLCMGCPSAPPEFSDDARLELQRALEDLSRRGSD